MEASINQSVFKLFGLLPIMASGESYWKFSLNLAYSVCQILFLLALQIIIYKIHLEQDFAGLFISTIMLLTSLVVLIQALVSAKGIQFLFNELETIALTLKTFRLTTDSPRNYSFIFYAVYIIGVVRGTWLTMLMIKLNMRSPWIALPLLTSSLMILGRINQQIYLMDLFGSQLQLISNELTTLFDENYTDGERLIVADAYVRYHIASTLQRLENIFGRLQRCLILVNNLFGWSTAALVVYSFVNITFQFRTHIKPLPVYAQLIDVFFAIICLFFLCRSSSNVTAKVHEMRRILLKPFYHASLWEQVHNFIVRVKLQPFEFTANGLYSINYDLFSSTLAASATYIVIMFQFDQKVPGT